MPTRKVPRRNTQAASSMKHAVAVSGPSRWLRLLLIEGLVERNGMRAVDLGPSDSDLPGRVAHRKPAVLLLDLPSSGLTRIAHQVHQQSPATRIVALSANEETFDLVALVKAGISGVVSAGSALEDARRELEYALVGEAVCSPRMTDALVQHVGSNTSTAAGKSRESNALSLREREIVGLLSQNMSNKVIADRLSISPGTVKNHIHRILRKTTAQNRSQVVRRVGELSTNKNVDEHGTVEAHVPRNLITGTDRETR
jgi:DNA-binding NarL/FixJ family response regulator